MSRMKENMLSIHQAVQQRQIYHQKNTPLVRAHFVVALNEAQTYIFKYKYFISEGCNNYNDSVMIYLTFSEYIYIYIYIYIDRLVV